MGEADNILTLGGGSSPDFMHSILKILRPRGSALRIMKRITEELIEKYVGFPDSLTSDDRARIAQAIRADAAAQKVADFYREYYRRLRGSDHDDNHEDDGGGNATPDDGERAPHAPLPRLSVNGEGGLTRER